MRAVKAFGDGREEKLSRQLELSFKPGALITGVRPASWLKGAWLEGTLEGRVGLVPECCVVGLPKERPVVDTEEKWQAWRAAWIEGVD